MKTEIIKLCQTSKQQSEEQYPVNTLTSTFIPQTRKWWELPENMKWPSKFIPTPTYYMHRIPSQSPFFIYSLDPWNYFNQTAGGHGYGRKLGSSWFVRIMIIPNRSILLTILINKTYRTSKERSLLQSRTLTHRTEILRHSVICGSKRQGKCHCSCVMGLMESSLELLSPQDFLLGEIINSIV